VIRARGSRLSSYERPIWIYDNEVADRNGTLVGDTIPGRWSARGPEGGRGRLGSVKEERDGDEMGEGNDPDGMSEFI
jgi:hypothetical protein